MPSVTVPLEGFVWNCKRQHKIPWITWKIRTKYNKYTVISRYNDKCRECFKLQMYSRSLSNIVEQTKLLLEGVGLGESRLSMWCGFTVIHSPHGHRQSEQTQWNHISQTGISYLSQSCTDWDQTLPDSVRFLDHPVEKTHTYLPDPNSLKISNIQIGKCIW